MEPTIVMSIAGLAMTAATTVQAFQVQNLEGTKVCDNRTIRVLYKDDKLYLNMDSKIFTMVKVPTNKGVNNVRRFETRDRSLAYLQLPEKSMILNNKTMRPVTNDCLDV